MDILYEGKAKRLYATEHRDELRMSFKDDATAFNGAKHAQLAGKGHLNKEITLLLYRELAAAGIETHFLRELDDTDLLVRKVTIIPLEVVVRKVVAGSLAKRTGLAQGQTLDEPLVEYYLKDDALGDPMLAPAHIRALNLASPAEVEESTQQALAIFTHLESFFARASLRLVDLKLEFGRADGKILLADEISPDTCRLWDAETGEIFDKDRFRQDLGGVLEHYQQILERIAPHAKCV